MKNNYQEFFLSSDPKEIEQAIRKRGALISLFPNRLGKEDETTYVLLNDDNSVSRVFKSKNYKEQQDKQTLKLPDLNNDNTKTPFTSNRSEQKNALSGLLNQEPQANGQKPMHKTKVEPIANYSLKIDSTKANTNPGSTLSTNTAHNRSADNNTAEINDTTQSNNTLKLRYLPTKGRYTHQINELKAQLPKGVQNVLNVLGTEIRVVDELHTLDKDSVRTDRNGIYNANKITLDSKHVNKYTLLSEAIHAAQNYLGMGAHGKSNLEFQEHVIKDLYFQQELKTTGYNEDSYAGLSNSNDDKYIKLIFNSLDQNGILDLNGFLYNIENYIDEFQEYYTPSNSYQTPTVNKFDYNWIKLFDLFGIKYK